MNTQSRLVAAALLLGLFLAAGCSAPVLETTVEVPTEAPEEEPLVATEEPAPAAMLTPIPAPPEPSEEGRGGEHKPATLPYRPNRLIIKNAELKLLVQNTDVAIDRVCQIAADTGGYIISTRVRYDEWLGENYKFASITLGVPVDQFELAMRRLRGLAIRVVDEHASGQDVTDEYVDLQSRLDNLKATRDRIRQFLEQAKTVEESLRVNEELAVIEEQIEQVQGRMHYLFDRAA